MIYQTNLMWLQQMNQLSPAQQKVLLALSDERYKWRTRDRLREVTALDPNTLDTTLAHLIRDNMVLPAFSKKRNIIFGLRERVGAE